MGKCTNQSCCIEIIVCLTTLSIFILGWWWGGGVYQCSFTRNANLKTAVWIKVQHCQYVLDCSVPELKMRSWTEISSFTHTKLQECICELSKAPSKLQQVHFKYSIENDVIVFLLLWTFLYSIKTSCEARILSCICQSDLPLCRLVEILLGELTQLLCQDDLAILCLEGTMTLRVSLSSLRAIFWGSSCVRSAECSTKAWSSGALHTPLSDNGISLTV